MRIKSFSRDRRPDTFWRGILLLLTETPSNGNCSALVLEVPNRCSTHWSKRRAVWKAEHPSVLSHTKTDHHQCVEIFRAREALKRSSALIPSFAQMRKFQQPTYFWEAIPLIVFWNVKSKETDPKSLKKKKAHFFTIVYTNNFCLRQVIVFTWTPILEKGPMKTSIRKIRKSEALSKERENW